MEDEVIGRRLALLVATSLYEAAADLAGLVATARDAANLATVLADPAIASSPTTTTPWSVADLKEGDPSMRRILHLLPQTVAMATLASWLLPAVAHSDVVANHNETLVRDQ
jgi:hypothetical protein